MAGVALGDIHLRFTWQAWHLETSTFVLRGRRGTYGTGLALVAHLGWDWSPVMPRHFAWQAWHLATSTCVSRGRRGTWRHPPSFHVTGMVFGNIYIRFVWQAWHLWHWAGSGGALGFGLVARGGTSRYPPSFHVVGYFRFSWQAWHRRGTW